MSGARCFRNNGGIRVNKMVELIDYIFRDPYIDTYVKYSSCFVLRTAIPQRNQDQDKEVTTNLRNGVTE